MGSPKKKCRLLIPKNNWVVYGSIFIAYITANNQGFCYCSPGNLRAFVLFRMGANKEAEDTGFLMRYALDLPPTQ